MSVVSFVGASADERAALLGEEFRHIEVLDFQVSKGRPTVVTRVLIGGGVLTLVGDPREALQTYLGGTQGEKAQ